MSFKPATKNAPMKKANPNLKKVKGEPDADDKKKPAAKKPATKAKPQWAGIANQMLGSEPNC